jgi:hypothetical protein
LLPLLGGGIVIDWIIKIPIGSSIVHSRVSLLHRGSRDFLTRIVTKKLNKELFTK